MTWKTATGAYRHFRNAAQTFGSTEMKQTEELYCMSRRRMKIAEIMFSVIIVHEPWLLGNIRSTSGVIIMWCMEHVMRHSAIW
jgi:hypothetical protein